MFFEKNQPRLAVITKFSRVTTGLNFFIIYYTYKKKLFGRYISMLGTTIII